MQQISAIQVTKVSLIDFILSILLIAVHPRWETWTGQTPWQHPGDAVHYVATGLPLFAGFAIYRLVKKDVEIKSTE